MLGGQIKYRLSGDKLPLTGRLFSVLKKAALLCLTQVMSPTLSWRRGAMSWTRASLVPTGGSGPRESRAGHGRERAGTMAGAFGMAKTEEHYGKEIEEGYYPMVAVKGSVGTSSW